MTVKNYGRHPEQGGAGRANSPLPSSNIPSTVDTGKAFASLGGAFRAWSHLRARGLTSQLVCRTLFARWSICSCGHCLTECPGGDQ